MFKTWIENWLEDECEVADALVLLSVSNKSLKDDMEAKSDTERDSENVKIAHVDSDFLSMEFWVIVWTVPYMDGELFMNSDLEEIVNSDQVDSDFLSMEFWVIVWVCWFHIIFEIFVETLIVLFFAHILLELVEFLHILKICCHCQSNSNKNDQIRCSLFLNFTLASFDQFLISLSVGAPLKFLCLIKF